MKTIRPLLLTALTAVTITACTAGPIPHQLAPPGSIQEPADGVPPPYNRATDFGTGWVRVSGNCDTREVVLQRDADAAAIDTDGDGCRDDGPILDLYTGRTITPRQAQIDHVFAEGNAWYAGAWRWTAAKRRAFSQDQANLRAVTGSVNEAKGDLGPDRWSPPDPTGRCVYARTWRATAQRWDLMVTPAQDTAVDRMTQTCTGGTR